MAYVNNNLYPGEEIIYSTKTSMFRGFWAFVLISLVLCSVNPLSAIVFFLVCFGINYFLSSKDEYVVTNQRVIFKRGFFDVRISEWKLSECGYFQISQGPWGRCFNYGTLFLGNTSASNGYTYISNPNELKMAAQHQIEILKSEGQVK